MKKNNIIYWVGHIIFCILLINWFLKNSYIRPYAINHPYREIVSAIILLLILYVNYLIFLPKIFYRNHHGLYLLVSLLVVCLSGAAELLLVESDIFLCVGKYLPEDAYPNFIRNVLFMIILRNSGFYLFFSMLGMYRHTKKNSLKKEQALFQKKRTMIIMPQNGIPIPSEIDKVIYFEQQKNQTKIYLTTGHSYTGYSSLHDIENLMGDKCQKINRNTIVLYDNITSFSTDHLLVKDYKKSGYTPLYYFKNNPSLIYSILQKRVPHLEQPEAIILPQKEDFDGVKIKIDDEKVKNDGVNAMILEEILKNGGISVIRLAAIFKDQISKSTLERRLQSLKKSGKIVYRGSDKTGGYFVV